MRQIIFTALLAACSLSASAATITAITNGPWLNTSTWSCGCFPTGSDNVVIPPGINVTINIPGVALNGLSQINVTINGTLTIVSSGLTVDADDVVRVNAGGKIIAGGTGGSVFSGLTNFALSPGSQINGPATITNGTLPISLLFFSATPTNDAVLLQWASASEKDFDHFEIHRSVDGEHFAQIGNLIGAGTSFSRIDYKFIDENPITGLSYYRLRAVDKDGSFISFNVVSVEVNEQKKCDVFPNPISDKILRFAANFNPHENDFITLQKSDGEIIVREKFRHGKNEISLPEKCTPGIYIFRIFSDREASSVRVIIE